MRLVASLAIVVGLMLLLAKVAGKRYGARAGAPVQVLHRQSLTRSASVAVITVGSRVLVVGTTDQQVNLLTELDPDDLDLADLGVDDEPGEVLTVPASLTAQAAPAARTAATAPAAPSAPSAPVAARSLTALASVVTGPTTGGSHRAAPAPRRTTATRRPAADAGALSGSVLSPQTWRQALAAATGKAS